MLGLGGFHIGTQKDEQESVSIVRAAIDHGVTFLDNCWDYNKGVSEERMGKALRDGYRQKVALMTKLDGRTAEAATGQLEQSLKRLQTRRDRPGSDPRGHPRVGRRPRLWTGRRNRGARQGT